MVLPPVPHKLSKRNLFALIIGIDDYTNLRKLCGAIADAKAMKEYLEEVLQVPKDHIRTLLDSEATRDAIICAFKELRNDPRIRTGDPIVIFYAGHGGELPAPELWELWELWGIERTIQCLLPQDYESSIIHPIPDRTIGALIDDIAKERGDNISVILDCCHSASGTRVNNEAYALRTVYLDSVIPTNLDQDIWIGRTGKIAPGFAYHGLRSHVLLAACGEKEIAYEHDGRGLFTTALLEVLRNSTIDDVTYTEVLERIHLSRQNPHCEGVNQHRVIFDARVPAGRQVRHSVRIDDGGKCVIGAGLAHGILRGVEFTLYNDRKRTLGVLVVDDTAAIKGFQTTVATSEHFANASSAKLTRVGNLPIYPAPGGELMMILEQTLRQMGAGGNATTFRLVKDVREAKLEIATENGLAVLKVLDRQLNRFGLTLAFKVTLDWVTHALGAAAHYYWYLNLTKENKHTDTKNGVSVDFYLLRESEREYDDYGLPLLVPDGPGLCRRGQNAEASDVIDFVVDPNRVYGIRITNKTMRDLYLNAFLFNNSSLSIAPYYIQPSAGTDAPLKRNGAFTIGYGPGGVAPFSYSLEEGKNVDVGYLKIFFATRPVDLSDVEQLSPFSNSNAQSRTDENMRDARLHPLPLVRPPTATDTWFTLEIPVVQRRKGCL